MAHDHEEWVFPPLQLRHASDPEHYEETSESDDQPVPVEQYQGQFEVTEDFVGKHQEPVGQLRWREDVDDLEDDHADLGRFAGKPECSGTLISDDLFLTAGHCFVVHGGPPATEVAEQMQVRFNYQEDRDGELRKFIDYDVEELVDHVFDYVGLDYALLKLDTEVHGNPGDEFTPAEVAWGDAVKGDTLCIIGHPNGRPKRIEDGQATDFHDVRIGYRDINTAPGSSGAGILKGSGDGAGRLVGIHTQPGREGIRRGHNHGITISAILAASPKVREIVSDTYRYESHRSTFESYLSGEEDDDSSDEKYGGSEATGK